MASVWNPRTQQYEDDGAVPGIAGVSPPIVEDFTPTTMPRNGVTGPAIPEPEPVLPGDLKVGVKPDQAFYDPTQPTPVEASPASPSPGQALLDKYEAGTLPNGSGFPKGNLPSGTTPAAPAAAPLPTGNVVTGISSTVATSQKKMTPQEEAAQKAISGDVSEEEKLSGKRSDKEKDLAKRNLDITKGVNSQIGAAQEDTDAQVARQNQVIARLEDHVASRRQVLESQPLTSFWDSRTNAARFIAAISGAVGTYAAVRSGTKNFAQERIDRAIDTDFKQQQARIENNKDLLALAKQDVVAANLKKTGMLADLQVKKVALLDAAERTRSEELAAHGLNTADIAKDEKMLAIRKKRDEEVANLWSGLRKEVQSSTTVQKTPAAALAAQAGANGDPMLVTDASGRVIGRATTSPKAAEDARASLGGYQKFNSSANQLLALMEKNGGTAWSGEDAGKMASLHGALLGAARTALFPGGGTLDEGFVKLLDKMVEDPSGFSAKPRLKAQMIAKLTQSQKAVDDATKASLGAAGIQTGAR